MGKQDRFCLPVIGGATLSYAVTVGTMGLSSAENVTVTDIVPEGLTNVGCSIDCSISGTEITAALGTLAPTAEVAFTITGTVERPNLPKIFRNAVTVATTSAETSTVNNQITQSTTVNPAFIDALGNYWCETEFLSNPFFFNGLWVRRGTTNIFDATWVRAGTGETATAVLDISVSGDTVTIHRTSGAVCDYTGTTTDGVNFSGTYQCAGAAADQWRATINGSCGVPPPSRYR